MKKLLLGALALTIGAVEAQKTITHHQLARQSRRLEQRLERQWLRESLPATPETPMGFWIQEFVSTRDPQLGYPPTERLMEAILAEPLRGDQIFLTPGSTQSPWESRGPDNVGGRTRALVWDPNDSKGKKVWAGAVTGGLWSIDDISSSTATWTHHSGLWSNLTVTCIAFDPNNSSIMYVGTGEGWGSSPSSSRGYGIWKSSDAGKTFSHLSSSANFLYINDLIVRNENGQSVVYAAVDANYVGGAWHGLSYMGLQRSTNGGSSWSQVLPKIPSATVVYAPADLELGADNRLWVGTRNTAYGITDKGGGRILYTDNGTSFTTAHTHTNKGRVAIACAPNSPRVVYALFESGGKVDAVKRTGDAGATWSTKSEPSDADKSIPSTDFSRGQAWYDLVLAVDPNDSNTLVAGAVNVFRSTNGASSWTQISKWSNNANMNQLSCSYVHADIHALIYGKGSSNTMIFGTDGGVFLTNNLSGSASSSTAIAERNKGYIVTQFYWGDISQTKNKELMVAGAQDNGTLYFGSAGVVDEQVLSGGDGAYCFISPSNDNKMVVSYIRNQYYYTTNFWSSYGNLIQDGTNGKFINPAHWDDAGPGLITCKAKGSVYRIKLNTSPGALETKTFSSGSEQASAFASIPSGGKSTVWIATDAGNLYKTTDFWATNPSFTKVGSGINAGNISGLFCHKQSDTMMLVLSNYGVKNVYLSTNGGTSFSAKDGNLPDMPVWAALMNPKHPEQAMIATELGIYTCNDIFAASPVWTAQQTGMGAVRTMALRMRESDYTVMAVSHGRGVFTSDAWRFDSPVAKFSVSDTLLCSGKSISLTDLSINNPSTYAYSISPNKGFRYLSGTNSSSPEPIILFDSAGTYQIRLDVSNSAGDDSFLLTSKIRVEWQDSLHGSLFSSENPICMSSALSLSMETNGNKSASPLTYQWSDNGSNLNGEKGSVLSISNAQRGHLYRCTVTSSKTSCISSSVYSDSIDFNQEVKGLDNLSIRLSWDTLYAEPLRTPGVYTWYCNGAQVGTGNIHKITKNGNYRCVFTESGCQSDSSNLIAFKSLHVSQESIPTSTIKPNPSNGRSYIMLNSQAAQLHIRDLATGRLVRQLELNSDSRGNEFAIELEAKGTFSVQQLDDLGQIISQDIWVLQ